VANLTATHFLLVSDTDINMDLKPAQKAILVDILIHGDDKAENIGRRTDLHRNTISKHLTVLSKNSFIRNKGGGVHALTDKGRKRATGLVRGGYLPYVDDDDED
jgi:DNA-binding MarR family transcriptional regulator